MFSGITSRSKVSWQLGDFTTKLEQNSDWLILMLSYLLACLQKHFKSFGRHFKNPERDHLARRWILYNDFKPMHLITATKYI